MTHYSLSAHSGSVSRSENRTDFIGELNEAIRQNPLPAALVGVGLLWLFMGGAKNTVLGGASRSLLGGLGAGAQQAGGAAYRGAREVGGAISSGASAVAETVGQTGSQATAMMRDAVNGVRGIAGQTAERASETADAAYNAAGDMVASAGEMMSSATASGSRAVRDGGSEFGEGFQQILADTFARQPLLLGAVGLAVGAAIAASMPASSTEKRLMGETADALKEKAQDLATEAAKRAETLASRGLEEAKAQGLTPEAAGKALRGVTEKVVGVTDKATEAVATRPKGQDARSSPGTQRY